MVTGSNKLQTTDVRYKLIKKIKDEKFDEDKLDQYTALVAIGIRDLQTCVIDNREKRVVLLEDFILPSVKSHSDWLAVLDDLFDDHALLKANFWKDLRVGIKSPKFALVPQSLFDPASAGDYLKFNTHINPEHDEFFYNASGASDVVTVFAADREMCQWLKAVYPKIAPAYYHQSASLIEGTLAYAEGGDDNTLYIYVDRFRLHIMYCNDNKLVYYNQFVIKQFSEYIRYIMLVLKTLKIDQLKSQIKLWGYVGKNSPHYHEFRKYIKNVTFGGRPAFLRFGYMFDEVQEHHFFDLFNIYLLR